MAIVAGLFASLFGRLHGPRRGAAAALLGVTLYTLLVGAGASVVRAAIMAGLSLFARQIGRRQHGLNSLAFVAAVMAGFQPLVLGDPGFQLTFAATLGLVLYAQPLSEGFERLASRRLSPELARKLAGPEKSALDDADVAFHRREYERLVAELEEAQRASTLPEAPSARPALDDLLVRLRLREA